MKEHILTALREELDRWEELLAGLSDEQVTAPRLHSNWSIKDVVAHVMAWQKRSIARLEAALLDGQPNFPEWPTGSDPDWEDSPDGTNAWIYETYRDQPWSNVYRDWRDGFLRFLRLGEAIPERDLLDGERFPWMDHYPLALVLLGSYEHHHLDHLQPLLAWLRQHGELGDDQVDTAGSMPAYAAASGLIANRSMPPGTIIPELAYRDVRAAAAWLCQTFGFRERLRIGDHRVQLVLGDESLIVAVRQGEQTSEESPSEKGEVRHGLMVRVADVDRHYEQVRESGAQILHPPETYPFGERQYTVRDLGSHVWTFSQTVADVAPEEWGGQLVDPQ